MPLRFIQFVACVSGLFLFIAEQYSMMWKLLYPFTHQRTFGLPPVSGDYKWSCYKHLCIGFCVNLSFHFFSILGSDVTGPYCKCIFNFIRSCHSVPPSGCAISYSPQQYMNTPNCCDVCQRLALSVGLSFESAPSRFIFS